MAPVSREDRQAGRGGGGAGAGADVGLFSPQTGVDTPIGAPKLELLSQRIWERAQQLGVDPKKLRDDVLSGKAHASWLLPGLAAPGLMRQGEED